ncbi:MAG: hypothetical protein ACRCVN_02800 [Spirochaetia bacterium]
MDENPYKGTSYEIGFYIFNLFLKLPNDQRFSALKARHNGFFERKVEAFFLELEREGLTASVLSDFVQRSELSHDELSEFSLLVFHYLEILENVKKSHLLALVFEEFVRGQIGLDTARRLMRAIHFIYYEDLIKLFRLSQAECLADQLFVDSVVSSGILTALEKGRFSDDMEDDPIAYRFNYLGKELSSILSKTQGEFLI